jgi:hypothetical protein
MASKGKGSTVAVWMVLVKRATRPTSTVHNSSEIDQGEIIWRALLELRRVDEIITKNEELFMNVQ